MKPLTLSTAIFLPFKFILTSFTVELTFRGRFKVEKTLHHCVCVKLNKLSSKVKRSIFTPHLSPSRPPFFPSMGQIFGKLLSPLAKTTVSTWAEGLSV